MYEIDSVGSVNGHFADGDYSAGRKGTEVPARYLNTVQNEMCNLVEFLGQTLSKDDDDQMYQGLNSFLDGYFSRSYIERSISDASDTRKDVGNPFQVPYKGIVDVTAVMEMIVSGDGRVTVSVYDESYDYTNSAIIPVKNGEDFSIACRLLTKNDDPNGNSRNFKISVICSAGCSVAGRFSFFGSVVSKRINYAQD